jgi:hypothetical protein
MIITFLKTNTSAKIVLLFVFNFIRIVAFGQDTIVKVQNDSVSKILDKAQIVETLDRTNVIVNVDKSIILKPTDSKIEYYQNGQNGIELIVKINEKTLIISTYDSKPSLKEEVALLLFNLYKDKIIKNDTIIKLRLEKSFVSGHCKLNITDSFTNLSFYFEKIDWFNGRTEIHQGEQFIGKASSQPLVQPKQAVIRKKVISKNKKTLR